MEKGASDYGALAIDLMNTKNKVIGLESGQTEALKLANRLKPLEEFVGSLTSVSSECAALQQKVQSLELRLQHSESTGNALSLQLQQLQQSFNQAQNTIMQACL